MGYSFNHVVLCVINKSTIKDLLYYTKNRFLYISLKTPEALIAHMVLPIIKSFKRRFK